MAMLPLANLYMAYRYMAFSYELVNSSGSAMYFAHPGNRAICARNKLRT